MDAAQQEVFARLKQCNVSGRAIARRLGRRVDTFSLDDLWRILREQQAYRCCYCPVRIIESFELDHKVSLADGGHHILGNLQFACVFCNRSKGRYTRPHEMRFKLPADIDHTRKIEPEPLPASWGAPLP